MAELKGGIFVKAGDGVSANAIAAKLRGEGSLSKMDAKTLEGFGPDGTVGVAIHPEAGGYFAVVDSADGAPGIGGGGWSGLALLANHLATDALWYRLYAPDLALAARVHRGSASFVVQAGDAAFIEAWLTEAGALLAPATAPKDAGDNALLFSVAYEADKYLTGPDAAAAAALLEVANALIADDAISLYAKLAALDEKTYSLALGVIRGEKRGRAQACQSKLAKAITAEPLAPRATPKEESFGEVILQLTITGEADEAVAAAQIARLDAIEVEAQSRSDWAQPIGLWNVASALTAAGSHARAHAAWAALVRRKQPHWLQVNMAVSSLLNAATATIALTPALQETLAACKRRLPDLGEEAQDAIVYNLACVYARAGDEAKALDYLERCNSIRQQNSEPDQDTDLESLWGNPRFQDLIEKKDAHESSEIEQSVQDLELIAKRFAYEVPIARAVPRIKIELVETGDEEALINRIGGLPCAPAKDTPWPASSSRPMQLVVQLIGKAAGGEIDLGDIHVVQIFADLEGDYYEENEVVIHRQPCAFVLGAPAGCEPLDVQTMTLTSGADDAILLEEETDNESAERDAARSHAWCDKIFGIPVGANLPDDIEDSKGAKMRLLLELTTYDDFFIWALFANADFSELKLEVVRG